MRQDPQYAPEHLALEAVQRIGPAAGDWVRYVRNGQPHLHPEQIAEIAQKKFTNIAGLSGAVSGAAGLPGAVADFGFLAWTQARMVLHIAAAYGIDSAHPDRALDLLVLQRVHTYAESARLALDVARGRETIGGAIQKSSKGTGKAALIGQLSVKLAKMAGMRAVKRIAGKVIPGLGIILGHWANRSATKELAVRARAHYRQVAFAIPVQRPSLEQRAPQQEEA
nr:EcsC family protein [Catelliglobosispora koreensis]